MQWQKFHWTSRRPLSTGVFSATLLLQKTYGEGEDRTHYLLAGKHEKISSTSPGSNPQPTGKQKVKCTSLDGKEIKWSFGVSQIIIFLPNLNGRKITRKFLKSSKDDCKKKRLEDPFELLDYVPA